MDVMVWQVGLLMVRWEGQRRSVTDGQGRVWTSSAVYDLFKKTLNGHVIWFCLHICTTSVHMVSQAPANSVHERVAFCTLSRRQGGR